MKKVTQKRGFIEAFQIALINHTLFDQELFEKNYQALNQKIESSLQNNRDYNCAILLKTLNNSISKG
ncbi:hypothetical protein [Flammeovirga sp. SJP92]|uniref:hypothetical protein n=1 Tax=Flammeovirga sp. SJP92 TaxID=1775430 RepID=UPI0007878A66|nr:hypothetical protein [Flammeovirga sp. SJP92]KXX69909.1 hypothetical protein AVL50_13590 [Flammeovirga sp. SJP92]